MKQVLVGATLPQFSGDRGRLLDSARAAEDSGLDSLWLFDHLWPLSGGKERPVLECFSTLAFVAAATRRIKVGTLVARSTLRNPALLAKMAATSAAIAPGRVIVTVGSGDEASRGENEAFGIPYFGADERVPQLEATVRVVHDYLRDPSVTVETPWVTVRGLPPSPQVSPGPALWVGGRSDDVLAIAGRYADGWNGWGGTPRRYAADAQQVLAYADGRALELSWGGIGRLDVEPEAVEDKLAGFVEAGARHLIVTPAGSSAGPAFYTALGSVRDNLNR